uniref:glycine cleavage system aminomethyltransferase GcvT n=1 Tax=Paenibacillus maysiensis TaxID=1155954 RepID=UPI00046FA005
MTNLRKTPLHSSYSTLSGVRCIDFGGWELPVQFSGIQKEHEAVRQRAGLFDVSHMGEFLVEGQEAEAFLQQVTTNDVSQLEPGKAQYSLLCYPDGGVVDDLLVYYKGPERYMLVVNASNIDKDWDWLLRHAPASVHLENVSDAVALLALQGPEAARIAAAVTDTDITKLASFRFSEDVQLFGAKALVSRTGYTGEDGFEFYVPAANAPAVWDGLLRIGEPYGLVPAGLGA